jgi:hypothetical protein
MVAANERTDVTELIQVGNVMDRILTETRKPALSHGPRNQSSLPEGRSVLRTNHTRFSSVGNTSEYFGHQLSNKADSVAAGLDAMTMDEINAEIAATRAEIAGRPGCQPWYPRYCHPLCPNKSGR